MARIIFMSPQQPPLTHLFMVDRAVGRHGLNHRHDVLLVQFFLRALGQPVPLDGVCGPATVDAIRYFQTVGASGDGSVRSVGGGTMTDGTSNTLIVGEQRNPRSAADRPGQPRGGNGLSPPRTSQVQDGTSNTLIIGEQPPANADPHVRQHYGTVRPPRYGEPLHRGMTIVQLNLAYRYAYGLDRFRHIDLDPLFPRELFSAFFGLIYGGPRVREAASRGGDQNNLRQIG